MLVKPKIDLKELYEIDDYLWLEETVKILKEKRFNELDLDNLIEELDDLGKRHKLTVRNLLKQIIIHLLLLEYWEAEYEYNANHWEAEIREFRDQLNHLMTTNFYNYLSSQLENIYIKGLEYAQSKTRLTTFPHKCPYNLAQLLDEDWFPE